MNNHQKGMGQLDNSLRKGDIFRVLEMAVSKPDVSPPSSTGLVPLKRGVKINKQNINNILLKFINFNALFYVFPFQLSWDDLKGTYVIQTSNARQIISGVFHLRGLCFSIQCMVEVIYGLLAEPNNVNQIFNAVDDTSSVLMMFHMIWIFWRQRKPMADFTYLLYKVKFPWFGKTRGVIMLVLGLTVFIYLETYIYQTSFDDSAIYIKSVMWNLMTGNLLTKPCLQTACSPIVSALLNVAEKLVFVVSYVGHIFFNMFELFGLMVMICMFEISNDFVCRLVTEKSLNVGFGRIEAFRKFMSFTRNDLKMGWFIAILAVDLLTYYAQIPGLSTTTVEPERIVTEKVHMTIYLLMSVSTWCLAAEIHRNANSAIKHWIHQHQFSGELTTNDRFKLLALADECCSEPVAVSCRFFHVTYGFLMSMLGVLVTYAIIIYQVQH